MSQEYCVLLPTYNNAQTIRQVIADVQTITRDIIVVNDGSTDETLSYLAQYPDLNVVTYPVNKGKGHALRQGFKEARRLGYRYAVTMDTDGQHYASEIPLFTEKVKEIPDSLIIGSRSLQQENMPGKNTFANKFSNFWFHLQTLQNLPDTQSGFRLYPIQKMQKMRFFTQRYEAELEMIVRSAWRFIPVIPISISVYYPPKEERITHFRPFMDFFRITLLNTVLTFTAFLYFYPKWVVRRVVKG